MINHNRLWRAMRLCVFVPATAAAAAAANVPRAGAVGVGRNVRSASRWPRVCVRSLCPFHRACRRSAPSPSTFTAAPPFYRTHSHNVSFSISSVFESRARALFPHGTHTRTHHTVGAHAVDPYKIILLSYAFKSSTYIHFCCPTSFVTIFYFNSSRRVPSSCRISSVL